MQVDHLSILWVIIAIVFAVAEIILPSFGCIFASLGALVSAGLALSPSVNWQVQATAFAVTTILSLIFLRPRLLAKLKQSAGVVSRTDALIGKNGVITTAVDGVTGHGRASIEGEDWAVKCAVNLEVDTKVVVTGASGIVLEIKKI